jgi:hypothetical protein
MGSLWCALGHSQCSPFWIVLTFFMCSLLFYCENGCSRFLWNMVICWDAYWVLEHLMSWQSVVTWDLGVSLFMMVSLYTSALCFSCVLHCTDLTSYLTVHTV